MSIAIGLSDNQRASVAEELKRLLADTYTLYLKTQNYHWNVTGAMFSALHTLFEEQYGELAAANDEIAERIRALGHFAPGSYREFADLASIAEADSGTPPDAQTMLATLLRDHETLAATSRRVIDAADEAGDDVSADLATVRMQVHQKAAWMVRSTLGA